MDGLDLAAWLAFMAGAGLWLAATALAAWAQWTDERERKRRRRRSMREG